MADDLIASFRLDGVDKALRMYEETINRMQHKAEQTITAAGGKSQQYKVKMATSGPDAGEVVGIEAVKPLQAEAQDFLVDAAKLEKERLREVKEAEARARRTAAARRTADALEAKNIKRLQQIHEEEGRRLNEMAKARMSNKQSWLDEISAAQESIVPKNTRAQAQARMSSRQQLLDDISEAQQKLLAPKKAQLHQAINTRGDWLSDLDQAAGIANQIEPDRQEHRRLRDMQRKHRKQQIEDLKQQRGREQSHGVMGLASAAIGIGGQAAFPMLNVAFASMSGMKYAGIAAIATAAGEGARAIMRLQDAATAAAESLGAVGISAKLAKGEYEAAKAVYGVMQQGSQTRMYNERTAALNGGGGAAAMPWMMAGNVRTNISNAMYNPKNALTFMSSSWDQTMKDMAELPGTMKEARNSMYRQLMQYSAKIEGPEQMWQRIQTAAASPADESRRVAQRQLELMDKQIKALEGNTAALEIMKQLPNPFKNLDPLDAMGPVGTAMKLGMQAAAYFQ